MKLKNLFIIVCFLPILHLNAQQTNTPKFGKGLFNLVGQDSSWTMKIGTRMQILAVSNMAESESPETNNNGIRL